MADQNDRRGGTPHPLSEGQYRAQRGMQRPGFAQDGFSLEKGGFNRPSNQPSVRPAPPPPMTRPAASSAPMKPPAASPRANWLPPRKG